MLQPLEKRKSGKTQVNKWKYSMRFEFLSVSVGNVKVLKE